MEEKMVQRRKGAHEVQHSSCTLAEHADLQQLSSASQLADAGILQNQSDIKTLISIRHFFLASSRLLPLYLPLSRRCTCKYRTAVQRAAPQNNAWSSCRHRYCGGEIYTWA